MIYQSCKKILSRRLFNLDFHQLIIMADWKSDSEGSVYNYLSPGCRICQSGASLVLFVTGRCERHCFYCPISEERIGNDVVFANEQPVQSIEDILSEARSIDALGTGITGGEPLLKLDYVIQCIRALKNEFGSKHHIHLYTGLLPSHGILQKLKDAGLDEIRLHPDTKDWSNPEGLKNVLMDAKSMGLNAGIEIPAIEGASKILAAAKEADAFLNLNELEFSDTNFESLIASGFHPKDWCSGAEESEKIAKDYFFLEDVKVHYCPSNFKDSVQLRERFKRRAKRIGRSFDYITRDGTIVHGVIEGNLEGALRLLEELGVPEEMYSSKERQIDIAAPILEDISKELKTINCIISVIERYPLEDGLVVERIPL